LFRSTGFAAEKMPASETKDFERGISKYDNQNRNFASTVILGLKDGKSVGPQNHSIVSFVLS
jgi:hypothetical protein